MTGRSIAWRRLCLRLALIALIMTVMVWLAAWLIVIPILERRLAEGIATTGLDIGADPVIRIQPLRGQIRLETQGWALPEQGLSGHLNAIELRVARLDTIRGPDIVIDDLRILGPSLHGWADDHLLPFILPLPEMPELPDGIGDEAFLNALRSMPPPTSSLVLWNGTPSWILRLGQVLGPSVLGRRSLRIRHLAIDASEATPIMDGDPLALVAIAGRGHIRQAHDNGDHSAFVGRLGTAGLGYLIIKNSAVGPDGGELSLDWHDLPVRSCVLSDPQRGRLHLDGQALMRIRVNWDHTTVTGTIDLHITNLGVSGHSEHALARALALLERHHTGTLDLAWSMTISGSPEHVLVTGADAAGLAHALGQAASKLD